MSETVAIFPAAVEQVGVLQERIGILEEYLGSVDRLCEEGDLNSLLLTWSVFKRERAFAGVIDTNVITKAISTVVNRHIEKTGFQVQKSEKPFYPGGDVIPLIYKSVGTHIPLVIMYLPYRELRPTEKRHLNLFRNALRDIKVTHKKNDPLRKQAEAQGRLLEEYESSLPSLRDALSPFGFVMTFA